MEPNDVFYELQNCQNDVPIFRRLISFACSHDSSVAENAEEWEPVLRHIVKIISDNSESGNKRVLLACHAFYALLAAQSTLFFDIVMQFQTLKSRNLYFFKKQYVVSDLELFKLLNSHGYLQVNRKNLYFDSLLSATFDIIYRNCMEYTRYSYFAYKVLHVWLKRTSDTRFWYRSDIILEQKLEAIIFSNWSNAFNDVPKQNAQLFNIYLRLMSEKYNGFLKHIFDTCNKYISWQNEVRFTILTEVLRLWDNVETMIENLTQNFLYNLFGTLAIKSLRCAVTKVYMAILRKLSESKWKEVFGQTVETLIKHWESRDYENIDALHALFKHWLEPTIEMHNDVFEFLWRLQVDSQHCYFKSHLLMIGARLYIIIPSMCNIDRYINDRREITRANAFATLCYRIVDLLASNTKQLDVFLRIKQFLWFNANASTVFMREHIVKYFKILYSNILKVISFYYGAEYREPFSKFTEWLHEFLLDCFEIGSCYQRKILALKLYAVLLCFTSRDSYKNCALAEYLHNIKAIKKHLKPINSWKFTNKTSLLALLRLVLDSTLDVRQLAADLIQKYFKKYILWDADKNVIYECGIQYCNSFKFYEVESGAALMKILAHWAFSDTINADLSATSSDDEPNNTDLKDVSLHYSELLLHMARQQLTLMRNDILKAVVQNCPFYGMLTALLAVAFRGGPERSGLTLQFMEEVLSFSKDAVDFFLSTLFIKQSNTAYSSSFAEMGLAIDEHIRTSEIDDCNYDELQLSPAHQVLISSIWMSLKVLCEIASEVGMLMQSEAMVKCSMDIIVTVLLKCRHKGVVESAGVAIANLSKHLYDRKEYCELPKTHLTNLLEELQELATGKLLHLTRRGAGLTIIFHKLVASDNRKDRPMVHFAVQKLLHSLENFSVMEIRKVQSEQDSPWARRLYFLCALVADKEIHASLTPYMERICLRCFDYIESDVWTVRNASLQLYGAVVPRLVGQCSGNKEDGSLDFADGYSFNHFITHYPTLAGRMLAQLQAVSEVTGTSGEALRSYAKIAHTLALLSRMWTGGCDLVDYPSSALIKKFRKPLYMLCEKPMIHIRQLAAKAYAALTPSTCLGSTLDTIQQIIRKSKDDNQSYGLFLIIRYLTKRLTHNTFVLNKPYVLQETFTSDLCVHFCQRYENILTAWRNMCEGGRHYKQPCYMLEILFFEKMQSDDINFLLHEYQDNWSIIKRIIPLQKIQPGFFQFLSLQANYYASRMKNNIPEATRNILDLDCTEQSIGFLNGLSHSISLLEFILTYLISMVDDHDPLLLAHMVGLARKIMKNDLIYFADLSDSSSGLFNFDESKFNSLTKSFCEIQASTVATNPNTIYMKNALILAFSQYELPINEALSHTLYLSTNDEQSARLAATDYVEFALRRFKLTSYSQLIKCCLILLKDEIADIRDIISTLLEKYVPSQKQHTEMVYQWFLDYVICELNDASPIANNTPNDRIRNIIRCFTREIRDSVNSTVTIENPFYHDDTIFYKEESKFLNLCYFYVKFRTSSSLWVDRSVHDRDNIIGMIEINRMLQKIIISNCDDLQTVLYTKKMDYLTRKRDFVLQYLLLP